MLLVKHVWLLLHVPILVDFALICILMIETIVTDGSPLARVKSAGMIK